MLEFAQFTALGISVVSFCLSLTSLLIHYAKRDEHPLVAPLQQQIEALRLGQSDIIDRVDHWTRRDRTRRLRAEQAEPELEPPTPADLKRELRIRAKQLGALR